MAGTPEYVVWLITATCNLNCLHCYARRLAGLSELALGEKLALVKEIGQAGVSYVNISGGEPLLHPHLGPILEGLRDYGIEMSVVTNATAVRDDVLRLLARTETSVIVSLDGPQQVHDRLRGKGSHAKAIEGLRAIVSHVQDVSIVIAVFEEGQHVEGAMETAAMIGVRHAALIPVMPFGRASETGLAVSPRAYLDALLRAKRKTDELGISLSAWCTPWLPIVGRLYGVGYWTCRDPAGLDVDPAGNVLLCDVLDVIVSSVRGRGVIQAFSEMLGHPLVRRIVRPHSPPAPCKGCHHYARCRGGCFARAIATYGDPNAGDPLCPRVAGILA